MLMRFVAGAVAVVWTGLAWAGVPHDSGTSYVKDALAPFVGSNGLRCAICVLDRGDERETALLGWANVATGRKVTLDDPFMQCSQTKGFCGVAVAQLVEKGRIRLDDPVSKYLPEFGSVWYYDSPAGTNTMRIVRKSDVPITVRMLLNHTAGFRFEMPAKCLMMRGGGWTRGMRLRSVALEAAALPLEFKPGTRVNYSNTGIDVAAALVEIVSGYSFEGYLDKFVLRPLDMKDTGFWPSDELLAHKIDMSIGSGDDWKFLNNHMWQQPPYNDRANVYPSAGAGLWTTANDQLKFYRMLMNLGVGDNGARILKEETVKSLLAVSSREKKLGGGGYSLGLVAPYEDDGKGWFGHGGLFGTVCMVNWHTRSLKLWVVQLWNGKRPWDKVREDAENKFFGTVIDNTDAKAHTGRSN